MRLPAGGDLKTRKGDSLKDSRLINGINEATGDSFGVIKRTGGSSLGVVAAAASQVAVGVKNAVLVVADDDLYTAAVSPFSVASPDAMSPLFAGLEFTAARSGYDLSSAIGGAVMIKSAKEAWVVT